jgi:hypothetical protein
MALVVHEPHDEMMKDAILKEKAKVEQKVVIANSIDLKTQKRRSNAAGTESYSF